MSEWVAKRFWKETAIAARDSGFEVTLDGRRVKTPAKQGLLVPTSELAEGIAAEWDAQVEKIDPLTMPLTRAANAAIDKVSIQKTEVAALIADYGGSDLLCYRAESPERLRKRQQAAWDPLIDWAQTELGAQLLLAEGIMHVDQPEDTKRKFQNLVADQGPFSLTALHDLVSLSGSLVIGLAAQRSAFDLDELWAASIIDETFQIEEWGHDEEAAEFQRNKKTAFQNASKFQQLLGIRQHTF